MMARSHDCLGECESYSLPPKQEDHTFSPSAANPDVCAHCRGQDIDHLRTHAIEDGDGVCSDCEACQENLDDSLGESIDSTEVCAWCGHQLGAAGHSG